MLQLKVGADPEFFVGDDGKIISAYGLIQGTKANPFKVDRGAVQVDGMALEFNIDPAETADDFITSIQTVLSQMQSMIPGKTMEFIPVADFDAEYMATLPKEATELGCSADFNAWEGGANPKPDESVTFRTAAGHVHIGWGEGYDIANVDHLADCRLLTRALDASLGAASVILDPDTRRRSLYGKAGAFRPKPYGMEYRVLSNFWLRDPELMRWVFNTTKDMFHRVADGYIRQDRVSAPVIPQCINTSNRTKARYVLDYFGVQLP